MSKPDEIRSNDMAEEVPDNDWVKKIEPIENNDEQVRVVVKTLEGEEVVYQVYRHSAFSCF